MIVCTFLKCLVVASGILTLLTGVTWFGRILVSVSTWLKHGEWPEYSVLQLLYEIQVQPPQTDFLGIQKIINWCLAQSLTGTVFVATLLFYGLTLWLAIGAGSCVQEQERLKKQKEERRNRATKPELSLEQLVEGWDKQDDPLGLHTPFKPKS
jgi:hypothetical protein